MRCRLIPARAGKTGRVRRRRWCRGAHPRACGENVPSWPALVGYAGSSPGVRATRRGVGGRVWRAGLIPARAGKTVVRRRTASSERAHPRACGENLMNSSSSTRVKGSSPRVRGKPDGAGDPGAEVGLIPACAGKTGRRPRAPLRRSAHPRVCGENPSSGRQFPPVRGSSPRVRGKPRQGGKLV